MKALIDTLRKWQVHHEAKANAHEALAGELPYNSVEKTKALNRADKHMHKSEDLDNAIYILTHMHEYEPK